MLGYSNVKEIQEKLGINEYKARKLYRKALKKAKEQNILVFNSLVPNVTLNELLPYENVFYEPNNKKRG